MNMRVYDFSNLSTFNLNAWLFVGILVLFGLLALIISLLKFNVSRFAGSDASKFLDEHRSIVHMIWVFSFIASLFIGGNQIRNYMYVKHVDLFHEVKGDKGRISKVYYNTILGVDYVTISVNNKNYTMKKDGRYVSARNLLEGDFIEVKFFEDEKNVEVVYIDVLNC